MLCKYVQSKPTYATSCRTEQKVVTTGWSSDWVPFIQWVQIVQKRKKLSVVTVQSSVGQFWAGSSCPQAQCIAVLVPMLAGVLYDSFRLEAGAFKPSRMQYEQPC